MIMTFVRLKNLQPNRPDTGSCTLFSLSAVLRYGLVQCLTTSSGAEYSVALLVGPALGNVCSFSGAISPFIVTVKSAWSHTYTPPFVVME